MYELDVEVLGELVVLSNTVATGFVVGESRADENRREVETIRFPMLDRPIDTEELVMSHRLVERSETELREVLAHFLGEELEEVDDELRLTGETRS